MSKSVNLDRLSDETILELRFCQLGIKIEGSWFEKLIDQVRKELSSRNITFLPKCYLADEWLCPDEEPVIGIPFYLAHPRLKKLENKMMLEVEGGTKESFLKLLRHETGHAVNYAYKFYKRKLWRKHFGSFDEEYPEKYKYRPYSKNFVRHLEGWYAQYHPDEDFAETFAVWLNPGSDWQNKYKGWKALNKLKYVDKIMTEVAGRRPKKETGDKYWDTSKMKTKLINHYNKRKKLYEDDYPDFHDFHLKKIFTLPEDTKSKKKAYKIIKENRRGILKEVAFWTGERKFIINRLLKNVIDRTKALDLAVTEGEQTSMMDLCIYITSQVMNYIYTGRFKKKHEEVKSSRNI